MVSKNRSLCPVCKGKLRPYDAVNRIIKGKGGYICRTKLRRLKCGSCGVLHREMPDCIFPYKHYDAEIIRGVLEGFIDVTTMGYEDYPCEMTMERWKKEFAK